MMKTYFENRTEEYEEVTKDMNKIYSKVVKKFPEIKESDIVTKYCNDYNSFACIITQHPLFKNLLKTKLVAGRLFDYFTNEEKEAIIAHELGHYNHVNKSPDINRFTRQAAWDKEYNLHDKFSLFYKVACLLSKKIKHRDDRLRKRYLLTEFYADRKTVEAGYREQMISVLQKILLRYTSEDSCSRKIKKRIKNLEEKLR